MSIRTKTLSKSATIIGQDGYVSQLGITVKATYRDNALTLLTLGATPHAPCDIIQLVRDGERGHITMASGLTVIL
jgi:hypothetical protein